MKRKLSLLLSVFIFVLSFSSCDSEDKAVNVKSTPVVAVEAYSDTKFAADLYCNANGYELVECATSADAIVFVENGKYDYVVLDEFTTINVKDYDLKLVETCDYSIKYCLGISENNEALQSEVNKSIVELKSDGTLDTVVKNYFGGKVNQTPLTDGKVLRILCYPNMDNRIYFDESGIACGLDVDIMTAICNYAGYTPIFISAEYNDLFDMLRNGEGDIILMVDEAITENTSGCIFSDTYFEKKFMF